MMYYRTDVACIQIPSDILWELQEEETIAEYGNYLHEFRVIFHEESTGWKTIADGETRFFRLCDRCLNCMINCRILFGL